ncbi:transposase, putative [Thiorhodococcus drewsii AZ1]|uniref:Transposase, putative n=1 Tax=Thiorhodococcus drewsii AZ1 TaxID=765913 RepID=G2E5U9_9GAMM|nr:transposase [Thiorhodococcus drewsii]EGV28594.1 transposase, putative [Thiorhodococcus drewsii AZ1]
MSTSYSPELKANLIAKMLPPQSVPVRDLARETQIPKDTLYSWRSRALKARQGTQERPSSGSGERSSGEKFAIVLETATLDDTQLSAYCRRQGLYVHEIMAWRSACEQANAAGSAPVDRTKARADQQRLKALEQELLRKEKALAEAAALLVLQKKVRHWLGDADA